VNPLSAANGELSASVRNRSSNIVNKFLLSDANVLDDLSQERRRNVSA
jgi:hypothetical protein